MHTVSEARAAIAARVRVLESETVELDASLGRVLAADAHARRALPPRDNSAMDGYAVRSQDTPGTLPIAAEIPAGASRVPAHQPGTATRIMTGAAMPAGADAVVIRENVTVDGDRASLSSAAAVGANIRRAGEDIEAGALAVAGGAIVGPGDIGLLAALGFPELTVTRRPRVSILSTGNELVELTANPAADRIINSNAHALAAQVREAGGIPKRWPIARDDLGSVTEAIATAVVGADVLLTSGGVSVGDYDFVKEALVQNGVEPDFWKVAVKPGKPLVFGATPTGALVFGLPGNPVSSMVSFELFVRPALRAMCGASRTLRPSTSVKLDRSYRKVVGRTHFLRARLHREGDIVRAELASKQGSGMLTSMSDIDALVVVPADTTKVDAGERLQAILLTEK